MSEVEETAQKNKIFDGLLSRVERSAEAERGVRSGTLGIAVKKAEPAKRVIEAAH